MANSFVIVLISLLFLRAPLVLAIETEWESNYLGLNEGLPHLRVNAVLQDQQGFIWSGTPGGLSRFDGNNFRHFTAKNSELPSNNVTSLYESESGVIWIGTDKGIATFSKGRLVLSYSEKSKTLKVNAFLELRNGNILIGTDREVMVNDKNTTSVINDLPYPAFTFINKGKDIFIGSVGKVLRLVDGASLQIIEFPEANEDLRVNHFHHRGDKFLVATDNGIYELQEDKLVKYQAAFADDRIRKIASGENNKIFVAAQSGFYEESSPNQFQRVKKVFGINDFILDREKTIWLASNDFGLITLWPGWIERYSLERGLPIASTWSITKYQKDSYWVGSSGGLHLLQDGYFTQPIPALNEPVYSLHLLQDDKLLVGTRQGLKLANLKSNQVVKEFKEVGGLQINGFYTDTSNQLWILTTKGIFLYSDTILTAFPEPEVQKLDIRSMHQFPGGNYWFGAREGLHVSGSGENKIAIPSELRNGFVTSIMPDKTGRLWLTTYDRGLHIYDGKWHQISIEAGLLTDSLFNIAYQNGHYWLSSFSGLFRVPVGSMTQFLSKEADKIIAEPILSEEQSFYGAQRGHCCHGVGGTKLLQEDNSIWYVTNDGVARVLTKEITKNKIAPIPHITSVSTDNEFYNTLYGTNGPLRLNGRNVSIRLSGSSYRDPQSNRYLVKVTGVHDDWQELGTNNFLLLPNLSPGAYTLAVKSSNNSGIFNEEAKTLHFVISGTVAESRWFKVALLVLSILLFYLIYGVLKARSLTLVVKMKENAESLEQENDQLMKKISGLENFIDHHVFEDHLTGAYTMRFLEHQLSMDIPYYERIISLDVERVSIVFIMIDIDDFKQVNIKYSRSIGDLILQQITNLIKRAIRESDYVVRIRNDKFIIVFRPVLEEDIPTVTERIRKQVERCKFEINEDEFLKVTSSISYADYPIFPEVAHKLPWRSLLELTERGLNQAKEAGGNRWIGYQLKDSVLDKAKASKTPIHIDDMSQDNFEEFKSWAKLD